MFILIFYNPHYFYPAKIYILEVIIILLDTSYNFLPDLINCHKLELSARAYCGVIFDTGMGWHELAHKLSDIEDVVSVFTVSGDVG